VEQTLLRADERLGLRGCEPVVCEPLDAAVGLRHVVPETVGPRDRPEERAHTVGVVLRPDRLQERRVVHEPLVGGLAGVAGDGRDPLRVGGSGGPDAHTSRTRGAGICLLAPAAFDREPGRPLALDPSGKTEHPSTARVGRR